MFKFLYLFLISIVFSSCVNQNSLVQTDFKNIKKTSTYDSCANFSNINLYDDVVYGKIFTEYISLDITCSWNGSSRGYFVKLFMDTIKAKSYKQMELKEFGNIEITTYLVNNSHYINFISSYTVFEDKLIIDYNGLLSTELIKKYVNSYKSLYLNSPRMDIYYFNSLVKFNFINGYFSRTGESFSN